MQKFAPPGKAEGFNASGGRAMNGPPAAGENFDQDGPRGQTSASRYAIWKCSAFANRP
jgi:hypothetical protein